MAHTIRHSLCSPGPRRSVISNQLKALFLFVGVLLTVGFSAEEKKSFDVPAGEALATLKQAAQQAGVEIVFTAETVQGVKTHAVKGSMSAREALAAMVADTDLHIVQDEKTGALAVTRNGKNDQGAVPPSGNRPGQRLMVEDGVVKMDTFEVFGAKSINLDLPRTRDDAQPYVVFGRDQIAQSQATNLDDFFRSRLPMSTGIGLSSFSNSTPNFSNINLRGLGTNQTLILVDGRRLPALNLISPGGANTPDITGIPMEMIERIEVLPSTASGIYGGGATGGVINIIMRKDYSGGEVTLKYINTFDTDTARRRADLNYSASLRGGDTLLTLTASYEDANELLVQDRDFTVRARQLAFANNPALFTASTSPPQGYTTNIRTTNGANLVLKPQYGGTALNSFFTFVPVGYAGIASDNAAALAANAGRYNVVPPNDPRGQLSRLLGSSSPMNSIGLGVRQKIAPWLEGYANYSRNSVYASNSNFTQNASRYTLAATAPNNPFTTSVNVTPPFTGLAMDRWNKSIVTQLTGGLVAKLPCEWQAGLDYVWSRNLGLVHLNNPLLGPTFSSAVSSGVVDVLRDLNARPIDYAPYLVLGQSSDNTAEAFNRSLTVRASGPTIHLPAGPVVVSAVLDWQNDGRAAVVASFQNAFGTSLNYNYWPETSNEAKSGYVEAKVPLLAAAGGDSKQARLELQLAGRHDSSSLTAMESFAFALVPSKDGPFQNVPTITRHYRANSYTAGLRYQPMPDLVLRTSYGTGFLPPDTSQVWAPTVFLGTSLNFIDPKREKLPITYSPINYSFGSNPNLKPEKSRSFSGGVIYTPRFWPGFRLSIDYTKIEKTDEIASIGVQQALDFEDSLPAGTVVRAPLTPADQAAGYKGGVVTDLKVFNLNLARREVEAVDFQVDYTRKMTLGEFHGYAIATYNRRFAGKTLPADPLLDQVGYSFSPLKWKGNAGLDWTRGRWSAGWNAQFYDSQFIYGFSTRTSSAGIVLAQGTDRWPAQVYHDMSVTYDFGRTGEGWRRLLANVKMSVGLQNVFNREPPLQAGTIANTGFQNIEDPRLRRYSLTLKKRF